MFSSFFEKQRQRKKEEENRLAAKTKNAMEQAQRERRGYPAQSQSVPELNILTDPAYMGVPGNLYHPPVDPGPSPSPPAPTYDPPPAPAPSCDPSPSFDPGPSCVPSTDSSGGGTF